MATSSEEIEELFPGLRGRSYHITSPRSFTYNCIAWAAGESHRVWWPGDPEWSWWPPDAPRQEVLVAFIQAFATIGYSKCASADLEPGVEKVALFVDGSEGPTHAARQLPNGRWTTKLGRLEDIEHDLDDIAGTCYGSVAVLLKRARVESKE